MGLWGNRKDIHTMNIFADGSMALALCQAPFLSENQCFAGKKIA
jgi:hypothetical protein